MAKRKSEPKIGPHPETAKWVQAIVAHHGLSQEKFAEKAGMSRGGVAKLFYGKQLPDFRSQQKLKAAAPPHLKDFERWRKDPEASDPGRSVPPVPDKPGGYTVRTEEATYIAKRIDAIEDDELREQAMEECSAILRKLRHPSELDADERPDRAQRK